MPFLNAFSDVHGVYNFPIPQSKYLVFAGDYQKGHMEEKEAFNEYLRFLKWFKSSNSMYRIIVPGNHDDAYWYNKERFRDTASSYNCHVLDEETSAKGIVIGKLRFQGMAHNYKSSKTTVSDVEIHSKTQILITHFPPFGIFDFEPRKMNNCGHLQIREQLLRNDLGLRLHVFGHIHDQYGRTGKFCNVALMDNYHHDRLKYKIMSIDVTNFES